MDARTPPGDDPMRPDGAELVDPSRAIRDFQAFFEAAPGLNLVLAPDPPRFTMLAASDERLAATLTTREATIGRPIFEVFADDNPENPEPSGVAHLRASLDIVLHTRAPHRMAVQRYDVRRPDGGWDERYWAPRNVPILGPDGAVRYVVHHVEDVTEVVRRAASHDRLLGEYADSEASRRTLAESERQLRTLADAIPTLAWTAQADGYIDWYNARWYEYTGTLPDEMTGWRWQAVHDPAVLPDVMVRWQESIATGAPFEMTFPLRGADGRFRRFLTRVTPLRDTDGRIIRWFGTNTDVEAERAAREAAERASRAKTDFLATMSHELRTPLNAIAGYAELLEIGIHGPVTSPQREALARIQRSQRHLLGLINDVLNFAKLEAGRVEYAIAEVEVCNVIDATEPLVAPQLRAKSLRFDRSGCTPSCVVRADRDKLQQILLNLLSNAIKFTAADGTVTLHCEVREDSVAIALQDTGIGIAAERLGHVFDPFVQVDRRLNTPHEGTGLGLAISRDLARGMGGDLTAASTLGEGSTFTVLLPRARSAPSAAMASRP